MSINKLVRASTLAELATKAEDIKKKTDPLRNRIKELRARKNKAATKEERELLADKIDDIYAQIDKIVIASTIETAAEADAWWKSLTKKQQESYYVDNKAKIEQEKIKAEAKSFAPIIVKTRANGDHHELFDIGVKLSKKNKFSISIYELGYDPKSRRYFGVAYSRKNKPTVAQFKAFSDNPTKFNVPLDLHFFKEPF